MNELFYAFENVISKGNYDLTALLCKIDTYNIEGKITDEERTELYSLARVKPTAQYDLQKEIECLWEAVRKLQNDDNYDENTEIKEFIQPTGAYNAYMSGEKVKYNGKIYKSIIDNNVWSPDTYPNGWELITDTYGE